jgi:hypothetical protein
MKLGEVRNALNGSKLDWVEEVGGGTGLYLGDRRVAGACADRRVYVVWRPGQAFFQTALFHEWAHLTLGAKDGGTPLIWKAVDKLKVVCR